jgi:hypothetical protein
MLCGFILLSVSIVTVKQKHRKNLQQGNVFGNQKTSTEPQDTQAQASGLQKVQRTSESLQFH